MTPLVLCVLFTPLVLSAPLDGPQTRLLINGSLANVRKFPFAVRLYIISPSDYGGGSGTIISENWVLTAAHNVFPRAEFGKKIYDINVISIKVRAGINNVNEEGQVVDVEFARCHPLFNASQQIHHDICLLRTSEPFEFNEEVQPVDLPNEKDNDFVIGTIVGWGQTNIFSPYASLELRKSYMIIGSEDRCKELFPYYIDLYDICVWIGDAAPCYGDSGSGLTAKRLDGVSRVILGVLSNGNCRGLAFGSRVSAYVDWIKSVMNEYD